MAPGGLSGRSLKCNALHAVNGMHTFSDWRRIAGRTRYIIGVKGPCRKVMTNANDLVLSFRMFSLECNKALSW